MARGSNKEGAHVGAAGTGTEKGRIEWLDSLKGMLIFLVVFGHVLLPAPRDGNLISVVFSAIYAFHMPLFVFVSGLLSKHAVDARGNLRAERVLTYLFLGFAYNFILRVAEGGPLTFEKLISFPSAPWYLVSLALWQAAVPFLARLRPGAGIALTAVVGAAASLLESQTDIMAISKTAHFLPYFAAGYYLGVPHMSKLRERRARVACLVVGIVVLAAYAASFDQLRAFQFFVYGNNACTLRLSVALLGYLLMSAIGVALSLGVIAIAPSLGGPLSVMGRRTLQIYVIHRLVRELMERAGFYEAIAEMGELPLLAFLFCVSVVMCLVCSWSVFTKATDKIMRLRWGLMLKG